MIRPTMSEAKMLAEGNHMIPISLEIFSDVKTPIEILKNIREKNKQWYILESISGSDTWGRYTFLGYHPTLTLSGTSGVITIKQGNSTNVILEQPIKRIRDTLTQYKSPRLSYLPPFTGGLVGYFAYEFLQNFIPGIKLRAKNEEKFQDFNLMVIDKVIAFDHFKQKMYLIVHISTEDLENSYIEGVTRLKDMERLVFQHSETDPKTVSECGEFSAAFSQEQFSEMVTKVKDHIKEGDIFQAVISNRFQAPFKGDLMETYRILRTTNPSPYMVYMRLDDMEIACSSPETLVSLRDGVINSFPLAGTCPRGETEQEDTTLINALLHDEKELAEHDMLVDLARNDVGRVSTFGSVNVKEYRQVKCFSHVSHISSQVTGRLAEGVDALDVISSALPAGTLSGAPKKRACEIIDQAEGIKRGVYGGAIGYIDFSGNMDMCIGIRMAVLKDGYVFVQSGAGVVADSIPEKEYQESQNKARAVIDALKTSGGSRV